MASTRSVVFRQTQSTDRLPEWASGGSLIVEWLQQQGQWQELGERLQVQREGGYAGIDAALFLILMFASRLEGGLKEFGERGRRHQRRLAAMGGRRRFPSPSSMSRFLSAVQPEDTKEFGSWLLIEAPEIATVLHHPSVLTRDATGEGWHVFDWDPTITTLRHRALPVREDLPTARRRSEQMACPGYPGRKRGDVQFSRATLQHAGSGLWLGIEMDPGNGTLRASYQRALEQVQITANVAQLPQDRMILRSDGAGGNIPFITASKEANIHYVTRLAHYQLLHNPKVVAHLNSTSWYEVPSSDAGPARQATDLGTVMLEPAANTYRDDGSTFTPIETRVVVSRFPSEHERGAGAIIDGWHYELYATDLKVVPWPAEEVVAGYYGRCGQENRFHQEDRELGLDRIFSYNLPGQELANLIGLFVWNFFICRGLELSQPSAELCEQSPRERVPCADTPQLPQSWSCAPDKLPNEEDEASFCSSTPGTTAPSIPPEPSPPAMDSAQHQLPNAWERLDWESLLKDRPGWRWDAGQVSLRCPADALVPLTGLDTVRGRGTRMRFIAAWGTCDCCERRQGCINSPDPQYRKIIRQLVPPEQVEQLRELWSRTKKRTKRGRRFGRASRGEASSVNPHISRPIWRLKPLSWIPLEKEGDSEPCLTVTPPLLLPAELRKTVRRVVNDLVVRVQISLPPEFSQRPRVVATSSAERQHRRLTWRDRMRWNELPDSARVSVRLDGPSALRTLLVVEEERHAFCLG